ncbi:hypothetical protein X970_10995 [Pseudomonas monteilii SB3101]|uniref:Uncharacterized protein n=1 Tax=Pseudomonas monteilii SB3101 TaxID=1435058 RepID=V9V6B9_9PSED|nr:MULTISPECIES: hypothetical protein [Pseudomonas]AHC85729.1 hypothetical protein X969_11340 [Pseudomonas monteilii SB3078]AHC91089.1 hypothetical protein X970_10995 [Pseudomonas monteilii SB3101]KWW14134.1 hypothetical protein AS889_08665 [Pseudomonas putida]MDG9890166.1 hypothetical protein [Pseudomonas juntendi]
MFKGIFSKLFNTAAKPASGNSEPEAPAAPQLPQAEIVAYYKSEISNSPFVKESGRTAVLKDFLHEVKLKDGEPLSLEEKRSLGINTRLKITRELYEVLTPEGLAFGPKKALESLYYKATFNHKRHGDIARMKGAGIHQYSPMSCGDNRDCDWCTSMNGKLISVDVDFVQLIKQNCTCDYCRCVLQAKIDF